MHSASVLIRHTLLIFGLVGLAQAGHDNLAKWEEFDFSSLLIKVSDIQSLDNDEVKLLRGIVFGKHGRVFADEEINSYLFSLKWYKPNEQFNNSMLTETERQNLDIIREAESMQHEKIEPGDMRFWQNRSITSEQLGTHTLAELRILRAEIEAIHGKRFDDEPALQSYFEERYWYKPAARYEPSRLSETERANLAVIASVEKQQRNLDLQPCDMIAFQNRLISEDQLQGLSLYEMRILRNEISARRGRRFRTPWLAANFEAQPWYSPLPDFREPKLSEMETRNVATIVKVENRIHENLTSEVISEAMLAGIFLEDASKLRNEIYARHGRVFNTRWLQAYFESFPWYKAKPGFSEEQLSEIERRNIAIIRDYERTAESSLDAVEG